MQNKPIDFFLSGVDEPVALEIPLTINQLADVSQIITALQGVGIHVGDGGIKVVADNGFGDIAIVTPVIHPDDLRALYDLIDTVLTPLQVYPKYPFVRDIQHLPQTKASSGIDGASVGDKMIELAKGAGQSIAYDAHYQTRNIASKAFLEKMEASEHLFSGATISDPYTVASDFFRRDTRMATDKLRYALGYSVGNKSYSGHDQRSSDGFRYGFLYEYERAANQPFFDNTGIEIGSFAGYTGMHSETPVNRFTNPCVGRWFVWYDEKSPTVYNMYKIPENDKNWESLLAALPTVMHANTPQRTWIDDLSKSDKKPVALVDGVLPGGLPKYTKDVQKRYAEHAAKEAMLINETNSEIEQISTEIEKLTNKIHTYLQSGNGYVALSENYQEQIHMYSEVMRNKSKIDENSANIQSDFASLRDKYNTLVTRVGDKENHGIKDLGARINSLHKLATNYTAQANLTLPDLDGLDANIKYWLKRKIKAHSNDLSDEELRALTPEHRSYVLDTALSDTNISSMGVAIKAYAMAPESERVELFERFYQYFTPGSPQSKKLKEFVRSTDYVPDEIKELSRGKSLFVDHIKRAREKIAFMKAQQTLGQKMQAKSQPIHDVHAQEH